MNVAISGSRTFTDRRLVEQVVWWLLERGDFLIVGDAPSGVDLFAGEYLLVRQTLDTRWRRYVAHWGKLGRAAGHERNGRMIRDAEMLVAIFASGIPTPGTSDALEQATRKGIPTHAYRDGKWESRSGDDSESELH